MFWNMICITRFWIRSNSSDKCLDNPWWKTGHVYSVIGRIQVFSKFFSEVMARFNSLRKYNRVEAFLIISPMWRFHLKFLEIFRPINLMVITIYVGLSLIKIDAYLGRWIFVEEIRRSLHFFKLNWNLFVYVYSVSLFTILLVLFVSHFSTISAAVVSSTHNFPMLVLVMSVSSIVNHQQPTP
jgi:hypothetical protein